MALSINEEGEEFYEDGLFNEKLFNEKPQVSKLDTITKAKQISDSTKL